MQEVYNFKAKTLSEALPMGWNDEDMEQMETKGTLTMSMPEAFYGQLGHDMIVKRVVTDNGMAIVTVAPIEERVMMRHYEYMTEDGPEIDYNQLDREYDALLRWLMRLPADGTVRTCVCCDQPLTWGSRGWQHPQGGAIMMRCDGCGYKAAFYPCPRECPACGEEKKWKDDHVASAARS